jgi:hypothetical protein
MDFMNKIWAEIGQYINVLYLLMFMFLSYFAKRHLNVLIQAATKFNWKTVYSVLIIATLLAIPFLLLTDATWEEMLFTYCLATSLHEVLFKWIEDKLRSHAKDR